MSFDPAKRAARQQARADKRNSLLGNQQQTPAATTDLTTDSPPPISITDPSVTYSPAQRLGLRNARTGGRGSLVVAGIRGAASAVRRTLLTG